MEPCTIYLLSTVLCGIAEDQPKLPDGWGAVEVIAQRKEVLEESPLRDEPEFPAEIIERYQPASEDLFIEPYQPASEQFDFDMDEFAEPVPPTGLQNAKPPPR